MNLTPQNLDHLASLLELEAAIMEQGNQHDDLVRYEHMFAEGTYTRVMHVPAGTVVTGEIHRHSCINIMVKGRMVVSTAQGNREISAPYYGVSGAGEKKAGCALEDTIWINVFPWTGQRDDLDAIVRELSIDPGEIAQALEEACHSE